jgi:photosystem II stability/assembly factor-like uncharacterized protein
MIHRRLWLLHCLRFILFIFATLLCSPTRGAQYIYSQETNRPESVTSFLGLSPGVGGAMVAGHLLWTNDNGTVWTDITPPGQANQRLLTLFFLDSAHGWIVSVDGPAEWDPQTPVRVVRTVDGGRTWTPLSFNKSSYSDLKNLTMAPRELEFVDAEHGWFLWRIQTSSAYNIGVLFATADGGTTWTQLPAPPSARDYRWREDVYGNHAASVSLRIAIN